MENNSIYTFTISKDREDTITKDYCFLSSFDAKVQSSVLFLLSAGKDKKKPDKQFIERLKKELKTELDYFTEKSGIIQYLNKMVFVKDFYGDGGRYYNLKKKL